eukprot:CAMPEP_0177645126 /NCGR_PEP_ID=MMETSP0447-20121125/9082_1 /TAXON_ID=0 /ORGANISM="Stygamoeba regulata, Strain BSH-02190019" /LENGTH=781 /DNA_ID=CAMNT_0019147587 /DNA_START=345 /DNA_END=2690 /DNA_ORIENTATION=+
MPRSFAISDLCSPSSSTSEYSIPGSPSAPLEEDPDVLAGDRPRNKRRRSRRSSRSRSSSNDDERSPSSSPSSPSTSLSSPHSSSPSPTSSPSSRFSQSPSPSPSLPLPALPAAGLSFTETVSSSNAADGRAPRSMPSSQHDLITRTQSDTDCEHTSTLLMLANSATHTTTSPSSPGSPHAATATTASTPYTPTRGGHRPSASSSSSSSASSSLSSSGSLRAPHSSSPTTSSSSSSSPTTSSSSSSSPTTSSSSSSSIQARHGRLEAEATLRLPHPLPSSFVAAHSTQSSLAVGNPDSSGYRPPAHAVSAAIPAPGLASLSRYPPQRAAVGDVALLDQEQRYRFLSGYSVDSWGPSTATHTLRPPAHPPLAAQRAAPHLFGRLPQYALSSGASASTSLSSPQGLLGAASSLSDVAYAGSHGSLYPNDIVVPNIIPSSTNTSRSSSSSSSRSSIRSSSSSSSSSSGSSGAGFPEIGRGMGTNELHFQQGFYGAPTLAPLTTEQQREQLFLQQQQLQQLQHQQHRQQQLQHQQQQLQHQQQQVQHQHTLSQQSPQLLLPPHQQQQHLPVQSMHSAYGQPSTQITLVIPHYQPPPQQQQQQQQQHMYLQQQHQQQQHCQLEQERLQQQYRQQQQQQQQQQRSPQDHVELSSRQRVEWTAEEDNVLAQLVAALGHSWQLVASQLSSVTGSKKDGRQCSQHWRRVLGPRLQRKGEKNRQWRWSREEDRLLLLAARRVKQPCWSDIAKLVPYRTDVQCRYRYKFLSRKPKNDVLNLVHGKKARKESKS